MTVLELSPSSTLAPARRIAGPEQPVQSRPRRNPNALLASLCAGVVGACSGSAEPAGPDEACFRALDCEDGLVCVEGRCTADIAPIVPEGTAAAPPPTDAPDAGGDR
jgi:hypothetical protein